MRKIAKPTGSKLRSLCIVTNPIASSVRSRLKHTSTDRQIRRFPCRLQDRDHAAGGRLRREVHEGWPLGLEGELEVQLNPSRRNRRRLKCRHAAASAASRTLSLEANARQAPGGAPPARGVASSHGAAALHGPGAERRQSKVTCSDIPSHPLAVLRVRLTVMLLQERFFAQDLTVKEPRGRNDICQQYPIGEYQGLPHQDRRKRRVNGIARVCKSACGDELVRMIDINTHAETLAERNETPQEQRQSCQAKGYPGP